MKVRIAYITRAARAGKKAPETNLKTYIPAGIARALHIKHGDQLRWELRGKKIIVKVCDRGERLDEK